jgi:hypothetical protein
MMRCAASGAALWQRSGMRAVGFPSPLRLKCRRPLGNMPQGRGLQQQHPNLA